MGRLLQRLLSDTQTARAAIPAIPATPTPKSCHGIAESQESQGAAVAKVGEQRAQLLALAADEGLPAGLVHGLVDADVTACDGLPMVTLRAYLRALANSERMDAGLVPPDWGDPIARTCEGCGPVLLWQDCPDLVKACPWCFRRKGGKVIPRPPVACGDCRYYLPDAVNPDAGMGGCELGPGRARWPMAPHRCTDWRAVNG
ncbi:hypothetical protein [Xanthomonas hortorum]|uniref:Uncharacterized protein n=1 Tax=Xanthomonas hortorum pv. hederae TaxID=453603 RepID=A0A9X4BQL2_9XANT|nr:hypothetical protein [Xanthomonas hortorum]MDC8637050.1 hypothetical protein [Xanthomonas hortorum pv. hederae]